MNRVVVKFILLSLLVLTQFASSLAYASGTVVGNGGDPVFAFMEAARGSLIETVKYLGNEPAEMAKFCETKTLSAEQTNFCRSFFVAVSQEVLQLNQGKNKVLFVLRDHQLFVEGPDGKPMIVAARTELGAGGAIELHRDSVKTLLPTQVLFLIAHEFQHKVSYLGKSVSDNEAIGPFANGRDLIDAVASAIVAVARKKGHVGSQFGVRDHFDCRTVAGSTQFGAMISSSRQFQADDLMSYEISVGKNPMDGTIYLPESNDSSLRLKFVINEPNNCGDLTEERKSTVQIVRSVRLRDGTTVETILAQKEIAENPICPGSPGKIDIAGPNVSFACKFFGSEGTTSSQFSLFGARQPQR